MYDAVVFDNDGVFVEPPDEAILRPAARRAFEALGVPDPEPDHVAAVTLSARPADVVGIAETYELDPDELWAARDRRAAAAQMAAVRTGTTSAYPDVDAVRGLSVPAAVVSSNQQETVDFLLDRFDLADAFVSAYGRRPTLEDLRRKKPDPYFVERALADLADTHGPLDRVLMVGDSESDVRAAHAAGIDAAFLRREHCDDDLSVEPDSTLESLDELDSVVQGARSERPVGEADRR